MTPGQGFSGTVSLSCSGAPLAATCQVPSAVSLANGTAATFTVTVKTTGLAILPPSAPRLRPISGTPLLPLLAVAVILLLFLNYRALERANARKRFGFCGILASGIFWVSLGLAGCGGGSASVTVAPPPPIVTPPGTSTLTITLAATSSSGQPLQLQPIQLTLTVN